MSLNPSAPAPRRAPHPALLAAVTAALIALAAGIAYGPQILAEARGAHLHWPRFGLLLGASVVVKAHLAAVAAALAVGVYLLNGAKGVLMHRVLGWTWSAFMLTAAVSGLFINSAQGFNPIHLFSVLVLINVPLALYAARRHNVTRHSRTMTGVFWGGLIVAGAFAFLPGRLMWEVFFG